MKQNKSRTQPEHKLKADTRLGMGINCYWVEYHPERVWS